MRPFEEFSGLVAPIDRPDVDTDQIIPKQFLKRVERSGFGQFLFYDWRRRQDGSLDRDFVLNRPRYRGAQVLLTRENFGCGSSREHAPWALLDAGFRVIIAPSFADIFKNNCFKNGMLPLELANELVDQWFQRVAAQEGYRITVDLTAQMLTGSDGFCCSFEIDPFRKRCLLQGLDEIGLTLEHESEIGAYEETHREPWQAAVAGQREEQ
ncbi:MAG TPA: 3-isopropylmalate dehydratase small subunit [Candidatus Fraserbacteria bacterium]|nr:3-isopropylmalate dehydratase small subunit [Candidatus Fraserbacteria bacterium]